MASLNALAGCAVINALAFSGSNFLFHKLSSSDEERKWHDLAIESFQQDHNKWVEEKQQEIDAEQKRRRAAQRSENHLQELDQSMREYVKAWEVRNPEPCFFQYYHPSEDQKNHSIKLKQEFTKYYHSFTGPGYRHQEHHQASIQENGCSRTP